MTPDGSTNSALATRRFDRRIGQATVLVVDDDRMIRDYVAATLRDEGYRAETAANGKIALDMLARWRESGHDAPALILLDMRMPVMDGWAFAEAYRQTPRPRAPVVVITAAHDATERAEQINADGVIPKPFDIDALLDVVARFAGPAAVF